MLTANTTVRWMVASAAFVLVAGAPATSFGQQFTVAGTDVQVHGFASQAFMASDENNFLTMKTSDGSFVFSDAGVNAAASVTKRLRVGAQVYVRNVGNLGQGALTLDWAQADYRFAPWLGVRAGKVKTVLGLYNDTQDMEFLHTFAMLPQSIYALDMRDGTIAHLGADVYGTVGMRRAGSLSYTGYVGRRRDTDEGGYPYLLRGVGINFEEYGGRQIGGDVRWQSTFGLQAGASGMVADITGTGTATFFGPAAPYEEQSNEDFTTQYYAQYQRGNLRLDAEHRRYYRDQQIFNGVGTVVTDMNSWYAAGAYRAASRLELGAYYSRFALDASSAFAGAPAPTSTGHVYDRVIAARIDVSSQVNVKIEGHFMDGFGNPGMYPNGFYTVDNPLGLKPKTNLLVVRTGFNF